MFDLLTLGFALWIPSVLLSPIPETSPPKDTNAPHHSSNQLISHVSPGEQLILPFVWSTYFHDEVSVLQRFIPSHQQPHAMAFLFEFEVLICNL